MGLFEIGCGGVSFVCCFIGRNDEVYGEKNDKKDHEKLRSLDDKTSCDSVSDLDGDVHEVGLR